MEEKIMRRTKGTWIGCLSLFLIAISCVILGLGLKQPVFASEEEPAPAHTLSEVDTEPYKEYTNSLTHSGIKLDDYATKFYAKNVDYEFVLPSIGDIGGLAKFNHNITIKKDDDIVKFVPKELFKKSGQELHIGKQYGFYINTSEIACVESKLPPIDNYYPDAIQSTVLLFKINLNKNLIQTKSYLSIEIEPIFQAEFGFAAQGRSKYCAVPSPDAQGIIAHRLTIGGTTQEIYSVDHHVNVTYPDDPDGFVFPIPTEGGKFKQYNRYFLNDFATKVSLYNKNHLNYDDKPYYDINQDYGSFISQSDFTYKGMFVENADTDTKDIWDLSVNTVLFAADKFIGTKAFQTVLKATNDTSSFKSLLNEFKTVSDNHKDSFISQSSKTSYIPQYNSRELQIKHNQFLYRDCTTIVNKVDQRKLYVGVGDSVKFDYQINTPDISYETLLHIH